MLQTDKKLRPTAKDKYCGFIRSMKDKGRCNISSYLFQDKHLEDVSLLMLFVPFWEISELIKVMITYQTAI